MAKNLFTKDFYEKVFKELDDWMSREDGMENSGSKTVTLYIEDDERFNDGDTIEIEMEAGYECDLHDDSFDHAFGTWHDPCPYWEYAGLTYIDDVRVWVDEKEVQGFSVDDFWAQFHVEEHRGIKKGDKVRLFDYRHGWSQDIYEVMYYDQYNYRWNVRKGDVVKTWGTIKKIEQEDVA